MNDDLIALIVLVVSNHNRSSCGENAA